MPPFWRAIAIVLLCLPATPGFGLTITADYSDDAATENFFSLRPQAKAAVDAAAADLSALLAPTNFSAISPLGIPNVNAITGTNGITQVTADWDYIYSNPSTGAEVTLISPSIAANSVKVFVGMNAMAGFDGILGDGAPGGASVWVSASGLGSQLAGAMANMQSASNTYIGRGAGPVISTFNDTLTLQSTTSAFSLILGAAFGSVSFNNDTNNNGSPDTLAQLDAFWQYDHTSPVAAGKNDLYSVALHEMLHTLGFGSSDTWTGKTSGSTWLGTNGVAQNGGSGVNMLSADGGHLRDGMMSSNIYTGLAQEVAMDPSLTTGTRKQLTAMDVALLKDLGYTVAPVPEPGGLMLCLGTLACFGLRRVR